MNQKFILLLVLIAGASIGIIFSNALSKNAAQIQTGTQIEKRVNEEGSLLSETIVRKNNQNEKNPIGLSPPEDNSLTDEPQTFTWWCSGNLERNSAPETGYTVTCEGHCANNINGELDPFQEIYLDGYDGDWFCNICGGVGEDDPFCEHEFTTPSTASPGRGIPTGEE